MSSARQKASTVRNMHGSSFAASLATEGTSENKSTCGVPTLITVWEWRPCTTAARCQRAVTSWRTAEAGGGAPLAAPQLMAPFVTALLGCSFDASAVGTVPHRPELPGWIVLHDQTSHGMRPLRSRHDYGFAVL